MSSRPEIFYDPDVAAGRVRRKKGATKAPPNPAKLAEGLLGEFQAIPGWPEFQTACAILANVASTPGWEDADGRKTTPGAKPIGLAQWGSAIATAGTLAHAVHGARWPDPGIDPAGFIWLNWRVGSDREFSLELHASLLHQSYKWNRIVDGTPQAYESVALRDVVEALRTFLGK